MNDLHAKFSATLAIFFVWMVFAGHALAVDPSCDNPNLSGIVSADISYSGEVFIDQLVTVNNEATLTLAVGTHITMCNAEASILIGNLGGNGGLVAIGTEQVPIVFDALDPATKWGRIYFNSKLLPNTALQHVVLNDGGGNDPAAYYAPLYIGDGSANALALPVIDRVTINDSGSAGLVYLHNTNDPTAASVSNISINGSAGPAIFGDVGGMGGLSGDNHFANNNPDRIVLGESGNAFMMISSTWRDHGIPYELTGGVTLRSTEFECWPCKWRIEPGVTLLVHPGKRLSIGSGTDAILEARGTEEQPITITRLGETEDYWEQLILSGNTNHMLEHVNISWGGATTNPRDTFGMVAKTGGGTVNMAHVSLEHSQSSGMTISGGDTSLRNAVVANNPRLGLYLGNGGLTVRNSQIFNNLAGGLLNTIQKSYCVDAMGNYWGDAGGPLVTNTLNSTCGTGNPNNGLGDTASRGVLYRPWLGSINGTATNRSQIKADPTFVIADGQNTAEITVTLRDLSGAPQVGKTVEIQSTRGDIQQPAHVSDANGQVTAIISSGEPGFATITATNLTDDDQLAGIGGVTFWQGSGDTGGLIDPNGAPYNKPGLIINKPPFIVGFPMEFSMPMQNTQPVPLDVEVVYAVSKLNIGVPFTPVFTTQKTLAPGEQWDALGVFIPESNNHQCVQATLSFNNTEVTSSFSTGKPNVEGSSFAKFLENFTKNPCEKLNANKLRPRSLGWKGTIKHFANAAGEGAKAAFCLKEKLVFGNESARFAALATGTPGDYDVVFTPPVLTPPQVTAGGEITIGLAVAMNDFSNLTGELSALITANGITRQRLQWAAQADDLPATDRQYTAFRNYSLAEGQKLLQFADLIDVILNEMALAGIDDPFMTPDAQAAYLEILKTNGFEQETIDFILNSGWGMDEVDRRLQQTITQYESTGFTGISFTDSMREARDRAITDGNNLITRYGSVNKLISQNAATAENVVLGAERIALDPMSWEFEVGHESLEAETIKLLVKPLNLPLNWSYELSDRELTLDPGEIRTVTLHLIPAADGISTDTINIAVEGYVLDQLIGGIAFEYYVPNIIKPSDVLFTNGFE